LDVDLLKMPCAVVSVDAQDAMGTHKVDIEGGLKKIRLGKKQILDKQRGLFRCFGYSQIREGCPKKITCLAKFLKMVL